MAENLPHVEDWRILYRAMDQLKKLAPWEWMEETDLFGVHHPETDEVGFVSVMGKLGEHYAIGVYLGAEGLYGFWDFQEQAETLDSPEGLFEIPQLQASFEDRAELLAEDQAMIKELGLKFRGKRAWPMFRSIRPGFVPWLLEPEEVRFLRYVLEQTVEVVSRVQANPALLTAPNGESYLVRVPYRQNDVLMWEDRIMPVLPPEPHAIPIPMDSKMLAELKAKPHTKQTMELDLFMFPTPIKEKETRPFFPYILLTVNPKNKMILGNEFFQPLPSREAMWGQIPVRLVAQLMTVGSIPKEIHVCSDLLLGLLARLAQELGITLKQTQRLKGIELVKEALFQQFM